METFNPLSPVEIKFFSIQDFSDYIAENENKRTLIIISNSVSKILMKNKQFSKFCQSNGNKLILGVKSNPSVADVCANINELRKEQKYNTILAIGGGSCIDMAKAICALQGMAEKSEVTHDDAVKAIKNGDYFYKDEPSHIIAVPTTSGTGSEVTKWATIWDFVNSAKLSITDIACFPKTAILIPELTMAMPREITLSTGLDALSHAMEAYWAKSRNPLSQALALKAIAMIRDNLRMAIDNPENIKVRQNMCVASLVSGLAFSITRTTACHSISYPLTMQYGVPHGFACAITLEDVKNINSAKVKEITEIDKIFDNDFAGWIRNVTAGVKELKLTSFGIKKNAISKIADSSFTLGRMNNNPVELTKDQVKKILLNIL